MASRVQLATLKDKSMCGHGFAIAVELDAEQAWALAQLVKRIGWADCRSLAEDEEQTRLMIQATERMRAALAAAGFAPR